MSRSACRLHNYNRRRRPKPSKEFVVHPKREIEGPSRGRCLEICEGERLAIARVGRAVHGHADRVCALPRAAAKQLRRVQVHVATSLRSTTTDANTVYSMLLYSPRTSHCAHRCNKKNNPLFSSDQNPSDRPCVGFLLSVSFISLFFPSFLSLLVFCLLLLGPRNS